MGLRDLADREDVPEDVREAIRAELAEREVSGEAARQRGEPWHASHGDLPGGAFIVDEQHTIEDVNDGVCAVTGYSREELVGQPCDIICPRGPEACPILNLGRERVDSEETAVKARDGRLVPVIVSAVRMRMGDKRVVVENFQDITDRRRAEEALRESEEKWRLLYDGLPGGSFIVNEEYEIEDVNDVVCAVTGYSRAELVGQFCGIICPKGPHRCPIFDRGKERIDNDETAVKARDGRLVPIMKSAVRMRMGDKQVIVESFQDITEIKQVEETLRRIRAAVDNTSDAIGIADVTGTPIYHNKSFVELFGYTADELNAAGGPQRCFGDPEVAKQVFDAVLSGHSWSDEVQMVTREGATVDMDLRADAVRDDQGNVIGAVGVFTDITDRKRAEDALRMAMVGELAAGVAHEFRNIMMGIRSWAQLAQSQGTPKARAKLIDTALKGTDRGKKICSNLLRFARPEEPKREPTRVESVIEAALSVAARELENSGVEVRREYHTKGAQVHADPNQLEQVFLNLIINACHAMPDGGRLTMGTVHVPHGAGPGEVVATVSDTGTGIDPADLPRVFDPFFSTKGRSGSSRPVGTGLGLSVSQRIATDHGGTLTAVSEPGRGTTVELRLAAYETRVEDAERARPPGERAPQELARPTVLLVDDEEAICEALCEALPDEGFDVVAAGSTDEAIGVLGSMECDIVVSDVLMPGGGARAVLAAARQLPDPPPVVLITGIAEEAVVEELLELGAKVCLRKPFEAEDLIKVIADLC